MKRGIIRVAVFVFCSFLYFGCKPPICKTPVKVEEVIVQTTINPFLAAARDNDWERLKQHLAAQVTIKKDGKIHEGIEETIATIKDSPLKKLENIVPRIGKITVKDSTAKVVIEFLGAGKVNGAVEYIKSSSVYTLTKQNDKWLIQEVDIEKSMLVK